MLLGLVSRHGHELRRLSANVHQCHVLIPPIRSDEAVGAMPRLRSQRTVAAEARAQPRHDLGTDVERTARFALPDITPVGAEFRPRRKTPREAYARPTPGLGRPTLAGLLRLHPVRLRPRGRLVHGCVGWLRVELHRITSFCPSGLEVVLRTPWRRRDRTQNVWLGLSACRWDVLPEDGLEGRQTEGRYTI